MRYCGLDSNLTCVQLDQLMVCSSMLKVYRLIARYFFFSIPCSDLNNLAASFTRGSCLFSIHNHWSTVSPQCAPFDSVQLSQILDCSAPLTV